MKYEFTRDEIYRWLKEQNWECKKLEEILLKENLIDRVDKTSMDYINKSLLENMLSKEKKTKETENKPKKVVNKDNVQEFVDLYNGKSKEKCTCNKYAISGDCPVHCIPTPFKTKPEIEKLNALQFKGHLGTLVKINELVERVNYLSTKDKEEK